MSELWKSYIYFYHYQEILEFDNDFMTLQNICREYFLKGNIWICVS